MKNWFKTLLTRSDRTVTRSDRSHVCAVESLESRIAPAGVLTFSKGTLLFQGDPDGTLAFTQTSALVEDVPVITTHVTDGGTEIFATKALTGVKSIVVKLTSTLTGENTVDAELINIGGSVVVHAPKAANTYVMVHGKGTLGETPTLGSILVRGGTGVDTLALSNANLSGGVVFRGGTGGNSVYLGNGNVAGNVNISNTPYLTIGEGSHIGHNLLITQTQNISEFYTLSVGSRVEGNVLLFAGPGSTSINAYGEAGGRFFVHAGNGPSAFNVSLKAASLEYVGGSSNDSVVLMRSDIVGNARFNLAGGLSNTVYFNIGLLSLSGDFNVGNNLSIYGGGGDDVVRLDDTTFQSSKVNTGGKGVFSLGNGANTMVWTGTAAGTAVRYTGGGGVDTVSFFGLSAPTAALSASLGGGDDLIVIKGSLLKATLNGGSGTDQIGSNSVLPTLTTKKYFEVNA